MKRKIILYFNRFINYLLKNKVISLTVVAFIFFSVIFCLDKITEKNCITTWFFGVDKSPSEILTYIGVICGAIVVIANLSANNRRNQLTEKGQLDIRFKDAALLLASENTSANLSGIYALHQIALEASKDEDNKGYVKVIHEILCAFLRENSKIEKDEEQNYISSKTLKPNIVFQTIIDVLFKDEKRIFALFEANLASIVLANINLSNTRLTNIYFGYSVFTHVSFESSILTNINFNSIKFQEVDFKNAELLDIIIYKSELNCVSFINSNLNNVNLSKIDILSSYFNGAYLRNILFRDAKIVGVSFNDSKLLNCDFNKAKFTYVSFNKSVFEEQVRLNGTRLEEYSFDEIEKSSIELTKPIGE